MRIFFFFFETGSCFVVQALLEFTAAQAGLELCTILPPQPMECGDDKHMPP